MKQATKKRRPWNSVSEQVYSISSSSAHGIPNMNIATYVTPVTMDPKRYMIAVYKNTQTHANIFKTKKLFLLQALSTSQIALVAYLGKKSGLTKNKSAYIQKQEHKTYNDLYYFTQSFFVLALVPEHYYTLGDHDMVIASVVKTVVQNDTNGLSTYDLQNAGIIG